MKTTTKMTWAGLIMAIIGILIAIEFMAVDAQLFGVQPPPIVIAASNFIALNGFDLDLLMTLDVLLIFLEFHWQGERDL